MHRTAKRLAFFGVAVLIQTATALAQPTWTQALPATSPSQRVYSAMAYDPLHQQIVLFGGCSIAPSTSACNLAAGSETWLWDGSNWTLAAPAASPSSRRSHVMAWDAVRRKIVLFGGNDLNTNTPDNDTWLWDGSTWSQLATTGSPTFSVPSYMAFFGSSVSNQTVLIIHGNYLFGSRILPQTWTLDSSTNAWTQRSVSNPTYNLDGGGLAFDPLRQVLAFDSTDMLVSGGPRTSGMYWDPGNPTTWYPQSPAHLPPPTWNEAYTWAGNISSTLRFGGYVLGAGSGVYQDTWAWNGSDWAQLATAVSPPGRQGAAMAYDEGHRQVVLFGGATESSLEFNDTWLFTNPQGDQWTQAQPAAMPNATFDYAWAYDPRNMQTVLFEGSSQTHFGYAETWVWDGAAWTQKTPANSPPGGYWGSMADDGQELIFFGGFNLPAAAFSNDTWAWDGTNWTLKSPATRPPARRSAGLVYDKLHQRTVLFGGRDSNGNYLSDTWVWDGSNWTQMLPAASPPGAVSLAMAYDDQRQNVVLFNGFVNAAQPSGTWIWDGSNWTRQSPAATPPPRTSVDSGTLAYDAANQRTILFGGNGLYSAPQGDTWAWDGANWSQLSPLGMPPNRSQAKLVYDAARQQTVLYGGLNCGTAAVTAYCTDMWRLGSTAPATTAVNISVPNGVQFFFNGQNYTGSQTIHIAPGSYTLYTASPQTLLSGTQATFVSWSDGGAQSHTVVVGASALSITGTFTLLYPITVIVPAGVQYTLAGSPLSGTTTTYVAPGSYALGSTSPQTIAAGTNAIFTSWSDGGALSHSLTVVASPITVIGTFQLQYLVTTLSSPLAGGTVIGAGYYDRGSGVTLTSTANPGYEFDYWSGACSGATCYFVVSAPATVTANFSAPLQWYPVFPSTRPTPRTNSTMAYDSQRQVTVLFGGMDAQGHFLNDTWEWNGAAWTQRTPLNSPPGRQWGALAYDPLHQQTVLFGGYIGNNVRLPDTWLWDGNNWTQKVVAGPSARSSTRMAFDALHGQVVLFGGATSATTDSAETWTWNGSAWTHQFPVNSPAARGAHALVYDEARQQTVLFGGATQSSVSYSDTWIWNGSNWTQAAPAASPEAREHHAAAFDEVAQQVAVFGGEVGNFANTVWFWDGSNWTKKTYPICPTDRTQVAAAYDAARNQYVLFGGNDGGEPIFPNGYDNDTWLLANNLSPAQFTLSSAAVPANTGAVSEYAVGQPGPLYYAGSPVAAIANPAAGFELQSWSGACTGLLPCVATLNSNQSVTANFGPARTWVQQFPASSPTFFTSGPYSAMAYDQVRHQTVLVDEGGRTWTYDGVNWTLKNPANKPPSGTLAVLAFDEANAEILLFAQSAGASQTWTWDGANWTQRFPATAPSARSTPAIAYNGLNGTVVLFGGDNAGGFLSDTWIWDGSAGAWTQLSPAHVPAGRTAAAIAYDRLHQKVTMFGGLALVNGTIVSLNDTYTWNGADWTLLSTNGAPSSRDCLAMTWDASHQQILLFGGDSLGYFGPRLADTWVFDGATWLQRTPAQSPAPRGCPVAVYDTQNGVPVLFGGVIGAQATPVNDTWIYGAAPAAQSYTLTTNAVGSGSITQSAVGQPGPTYTPGTQVQVTAIPAAGSEFEYWSGGACSGSTPTCTVTMNGSQTATANFSTPLQWVQLNPAVSPTATQTVFSESLSMAYDPVHQQIVFFGGPYGGGPGNQTWLWNGVTWTQTFPATVPPARTAAKLAYDPANQNVVMFGGIFVANNLEVAAGDTWTWDGSNWTQKAIGAPAPPARCNHGLAFDGQRIVLFGGWGLAGGIYGDTWTWDGAAWTQRFPNVFPSPRSDFGMVYDTARNQVVLFSEIENSNDTTTWIWDGTTWNARNPANHPPGGWNTMAYDSTRQQTFLITENLAGGVATQTWAWDGVNWSRRNTTVSPTPRSGGAMAYDAARQQAILFGGFTTANAADTWALLAPSVNLVQQAPVVVRDGHGNYLVTVTLKNQGNIPLSNISLTAGKLGAVAGTSTTPATLLNIAPGGSAGFTVQVPMASVPGAAAAISFTGTYTTQLVANAAWTASVRSVTLP